MATRRGWRNDAVYFDHAGPCTDPARHRHCPGRWPGVISLGYDPDGKRIRRKVSGQTKAIVTDWLAQLRRDLDAGARPSPANYTLRLRRAAQDWLEHGLPGRSDKTIRKDEDVLEPILAVARAARLKDLTAADIDAALARMADGYSTAAVRLGHLALKRVTPDPSVGQAHLVLQVQHGRHRTLAPAPYAASQFTLPLGCRERPRSLIGISWLVGGSCGDTP